MSDLDTEYEGLFNEQLQEQQKALRAGALQASQYNPDRYAEAQQLSRKTGLPTPVVHDNLDAVKQQELLKEYEQLATSAPATAKFLDDRQKAPLAQDDYNNLARLEQAQRKRGIVPPPERDFLDQVKMALGDVVLRPIGGEAYGRLNQGGFGLLAAGAGAASAVLDPLLERATGAAPFRKAQDTLLREAEAGKEWAEYYGIAAGDYSNDFTRGAASGISSAYTSLLLLPLGVQRAAGEVASTAGAAWLNSVAALKGVAPMAAQTGGIAYTEAQAAGLGEGKSLIYGGLQGGVEGLTEMIPFGKFLGDIKAGTPLLATLGNQLVVENLTEQAATHWQDLNTWLTLNPEKSAADFLAERPDAALQTAIATTFAVGLQTAVMHASAAPERREALRQKQAAEQLRQDVGMLSALFNDAGKSLLRGRDPESFAQLLQQQAAEHGAPEDFYVDAQQLQGLLQQADRDTLEAVTAAAPSIAGQIDEAVAAGGSVRIPVGELTAAFAGTGLEQPLLQHLKSDPNALSQAEAAAQTAEAQGKLQAEADKVLATKEERKAWNDARQQVFDNVFGGLSQASPFSPAVNRAYATLVRDFYTVMAGRLNTTPDALWASNPLRVGGVAFGAPSSEALVDQAGVVRDFDSLPEIDQFQGLEIREGTDDENIQAASAYADERAYFLPGVREIPLDALLPRNEEFYASEKEQARITALAEEIKQNGYIEPVLVALGSQTKKLHVAEGQHRWRALRLLGYTSVPARVALPFSYFEQAGQPEGNFAPMPVVAVEVAPDPNNLELNERWMALPFEIRRQISEAVIDRVLKAATDALGVRGALVTQVGGYEGNTNPSLHYVLDPESAAARPEAAAELAKLLGYILRQDSTVVMSDEAVPGTDAVDGIVVSLPAGTNPDEVYQLLWPLKDGSGNSIAGGYSFSDGRMLLLNFSSISTDEYAARVNEALQERFPIDLYSGHSALITKDQYGYGDNRSPGQDGAPEQSLQRLADFAQQDADTALAAAIDAAERGTWSAPQRDTGARPAGDGRGFSGFFTGISLGFKGKPNGTPFEPKLKLDPIADFVRAYNQYRGNFDDHIASSIPAFRELQTVVGAAITRTYPGGARMLDIGGSEGALAKTISEQSGGAIQTTVLDPNFAMAEHFATSGSVEGARYDTGAFTAAEDAGKILWVEGATLTDRDGTEIPNPYAGRAVRGFEPDGKFDVVHEAMVFQFISGDRDNQIARAKELMTADGVLLLEEKFIPGAGLPLAQHRANEAQKDAYKEQFFTKEEIAAKAAAVGVVDKEAFAAAQADKEKSAVGMADLMVSPGTLEAVLDGNFQYVVQFWSSGNFKGYMASDSLAKLEALLGNMINTNSEFSTETAPRWVKGEQDNDTVFEQSMSTRAPSGKTARENPLEEVLVVDMDTMKRDPEGFAKNVDQVRRYVNYPKTAKVRDPAKRAEIFIQHVIDNLLWLYDQVPAETRDRSRKWYDGARAIVDAWAPRYGVTDAQASAVLAVLSPQKDWFMNVSLAERVLDTMTQHQRTPWDEAMSATAARILAKPEYAADLAAITGKTLIEVDTPLRRAMWVRVYDEAHNTRSYRVVTPEGNFSETKKNADGREGKVAWGSFGEIAKAISVIEDGTIPNISQRLGGNHKVRNFYNNIFNPNDTHGSVTIDTHAVAAGLLRPLAGGSLEVMHNFGGTGTSSSAITGASGTYGIYADAYRRAAAARGVLPREMQSITWEAVRGLYPAEFKTANNAAAVDALWQDYRDGKRSLENVREEIVGLAGGITAPEWERSGGRGTPATESSSYAGAVPRTGVPGAARGGRRAGAGNRAGTGLGESAEVLNQSWFFSPLQRTVENLSQEKAPAAQWKATIAKQPGVKKDELEWTGFNEWLDTREGTVTKSEILVFLRDNGVQIEEVEKGKPAGGATKYNKYVLDGGKNYRELLLTLPYNPGESRSQYQIVGPFVKGTFDTQEEARAVIDDFEARILGMTDPDMEMLRDSLRSDPHTIVQHVSTTNADPTFKSSHWDERNVVAHIRVNERVDADGKRTLFVEEVQSDWAQEGKANGFSVQVPKGVVSRVQPDAADGSGWEAEPTWQIEWEGLPAEGGFASQLEAERALARKQKVLAGMSIPRAPFVTNTDAWVALSLKRIIRYAAENGFERVAFVNGEQSAERYSLSKQISRLQVTSDGNRDRFQVAAFDLKGSLVFSETLRSLTGLDAYVGRELADRVRDDFADKEGDTHAYDGLTLDTGGEGMKAFYDKIIPAALGKVLKSLKTDATVGRVGIVTGEESGSRFVGPEVDSGVLVRAAAATSDNTVKKQLLEVAQALRDGIPVDKAFDSFGSSAAAEAVGGTIEFFTEDKVNPQLGFDVTDDLREKAMGGLALFQRSNEARGTFNPKTFEINLLEKADLSTFLHETGHFFLEMMGQFATQPGTPQQVRDDMDALLKWIGIPGDTAEARLADWLQRPLAQRREGHEKFAETFEQYLFNGKAPSLELQSLFSRFSDWLKSVYGTLQDMLKQNRRSDLSPEVQGVMDRMIASDEQIARAEAARAMAPMFTSAEEGKMSPAEWEAYQALQTRSHDDAADDMSARSLRDMRWVGNHKGRVLKQLQKEVAEKRKAMRAQISAEVLARQVYQAIEFLKRGTLPEADRNSKQRRTLEDIGMTGQHKLALPALKEIYGEEANAIWRYLPIGKYGYAATDGLHPDLVADLLGYPSADALVRDVLQAEPANDVIEALTDQAMMETYGDITSPEALDRAADEAIHNEVRIRMVATEMTALARLTGGPRLALQMAKDYAAKVINARKIRDLRPKQSASDAARAGRDADAALKAGDREEAAKQKRNQLLHLEATKQTYEAQREIEKTIAAFKTVFAPNARLAKTRNMDIVNAARAVLSAYGIGPKGLNPQDSLAQVQEYDPDLYADLVSIMGGLPQGVADHRDMTVGEFRALRDTVLSLWHLSRRSKQVEVDGKMVEIDAIADEITTRVEELSGGELPPLPGYASTTTRADEFKVGALGIRSALRRVESWADTMGAPFTRYIFQPISEAVTRYRDARNGWVSQYLALLKGIEANLSFHKITARELGGFTFNGGKSEILHAILHTGNDSNKRKLMLGRGWATEDAEGNLDTSNWDAFIARLAKEGVLTKADFDFVQSVWDLLESMKPESQRAHKAMYGYYFDEITANPVQTPFGEYRGGYVPAIADALSSPDQAQKREAEELLHAGNSFMFPTTGRGFTKARSEGYTRPLELDLRLMASHLDKVARFVHIEPAVKDVGRLLVNKRVARALNGFDQTAISQMLNPWLQRTARQTVSVPGKLRQVDKFWNGLRKRAGMQVMVANVINTLQQLTGFSVAAIRVPAPALLRSLKTYMGSPKESAARIMALSPWMKDRMTSQSFEMTAAIEQILVNPSVYENSKAYLERNGYFMQQALQNIVDTVVWQASYDNAVKGGADSAAAVRIADADVRLTQSSFAPEDISSFEANTPFVRQFTQFAGYFNMLANTLGSEGAKAIREMGFKSAPRLAWIWFAGLAMPAFLAALISEGAPGDDDDEDGDGTLDEWLAMFFGSQGRTLTAMVPVVGQATQLTVNLTDDKKYNDRFSVSPAVSMAEAGIRGAVGVLSGDLFDEKVKKTEVRDALMLIGLVTGLPAGALARPAGYVAAIEEGKANPENGLELAKGLVVGR